MKLHFLTSADSLLLFPVFLSAKSEDSTPASSPKNVKLSYIRFWTALPETAGNYDLLVRAPGAKTPETLSSGMMHFSAFYREIKPATYKLKIFKSGDRKTSVASLDLTTKPNDYNTVLVTQDHDEIHAEIINDTIDPNVHTASLTIRQFYPGALITVQVPPAIQSASLAAGEKQTLVGLPLSKLHVKLLLTLPDGRALESNHEMDLRGSKRATFILSANDGGRLQPSFTTDGRNPE